MDTSKLPDTANVSNASCSPFWFSVRSSLLTFLIHHNPFYLLSALSMLAGCYALNSGLDTHPGDVGKLLLLIGTLNVYEFLLIGLGLYLIRHRGLLRDGRTLLLLEATFLVDLAFLNAETAQVSVATGIAVNAIALLLACLKVTLAARILAGRLPVRSLSYLLLQLAALFALPSIFKWSAHGASHGGGHVSHQQFYWTWWVVGLLPVCYELIHQVGRSAFTSVGEPRVWITLRRVYFVLPYASILAHLGMLHWVYRVSCTAGDIAPVLLGLSVVIARPGRLGSISPWRALQVRLLLPAGAVALTLIDPPPVLISLTAHTHVTPAALSAGGAYLVYIYAFVIPYAAWFVAAGVGVGAIALFGPSLAQLQAFAILCWQLITTWINRILPRTALQWGVVAVGGAFAFLGLGAALSLRQPPAREPVVAPTET